MKHRKHTEKVVAVRAVQLQPAENGTLFFLFTAGQVAEVLSEMIVRPVPFSPSFLPGVTLWRGRLLPVIDLEKRFAFSHGKKREDVRFLVVRTGAPLNRAGGQVFHCVLRLSTEIHCMDISETGTMADTEFLDVDQSLVRGIYQWRKDIYMVPDIAFILQNQPSVDS